MRDIEYNLEQITELTLAITHYQGLYNYISQLEKGNKELQDLYNIPNKNSVWNKISVIQTIQSWSNTSCGWETMGGSAISSAFTTVIYNKYLQVMFVYYNGKLAYIAKNDGSVDMLNLPGIIDCNKKLDVIYKSKR